MTSDRFAVAALGVTVGIDVHQRSREERRTIEEAWRDARGSRPEESPTRTVVVAPGPFDRALNDLSTAVTSSAIDANRGQLWMLHAAGVADDHGRTVALVGPSGMGKTTAVRSLARLWGYVSDETIGVTPDGQILAHPKPLSIVRPGRPVKEQIAASALGLRPSPDAGLRLAGVIVLNRDSRITSPRLVPLTLAEALSELAPHTSYLTEMPRPLQMSARLLTELGGAYRADYRHVHELTDMVAQVFTHVRTHAPEQSLRPGPVSPRATAPRRSAGGSEGLSRGAHVDALCTGEDECVVLRENSDGGGQMFVLAGIGATAWATAHASTRAELAATILDRHGPPPGPIADVGSLVGRVVDDLVEAGLLSENTASG